MQIGRNVMTPVQLLVVLILAGVVLLTTGCINVGGGTQITWTPHGAVAKDAQGVDTAALQASGTGTATAPSQAANAADATFHRAVDTGLSGDQGQVQGRGGTGQTDSGNKSLDKSTELSIPLSSGAGATGVAGAAGSLVSSAISALTTPAATAVVPAKATTSPSSIATATTDPACVGDGCERPVEASAAVPPSK